MKKIYLVIFLISIYSVCFTQVRVACIGNSITYGYGLDNREKNSYPSRLSNLLGDDYIVKNFGLNGATLLRKGDIPYLETKEFKEAREFNPNIVFIELGTNDSKKQNRVYMDNFINDYMTLIESFRILKSNPRIILLIPPPVFYTPDTMNISNKIITDSIIPKIRECAYKKNVEVINLNNIFIDSILYFPDLLHPNSSGAAIIAKRCFETLKIDKGNFDILHNLKLEGVRSNYYGYECFDFNFENNPCKIVKPKVTAKGNPWIWKARFWGHFPQTELALLERGFHLVYCDVADLFGNDTAVKRWNNFYNFIQTGGLNKKAILMGLSRGGLIVYNWAVENPEKISCIYVDAPVLDIKSWPGRFYPYGGSSEETWEKCKKAYGLKSDEEAKDAKVSPVDKAGRIAKMNAPMLHIIGMADKTVPPEFNSLPFADKIRQAGGSIQVIEKPGVGHHPHSLANPTPIIDFILKSMEK